MSFFQILFSPAGRIRRRDYWVYSIGLWVTLMAAQMIVHGVILGRPGKSFFSDGAWYQGKTTPYALFAAAIYFARQWPHFCIAAKRWHDRGRPAWIAAAYIAASVTSIWAQATFGIQAAHINLLLQYLISAPLIGLMLWQFIECGCLDGTPGPNRYGRSPKGRGADPSAVF
ncbi:DUF805 domain-containing protein [Asticcacaulis solisilvae]|uniref:DUF805 domain-containing protein n=1 Tax=Asticcacaulis solisilvae TaxID=1217274 RepID=UPI003FD74960